MLGAWSQSRQDQELVRGKQPKHPAPDLKLGCSPEEGLRLGPGTSPAPCLDVTGDIRAGCRGGICLPSACPGASISGKGETARLWMVDQIKF